MNDPTEAFAAGALYHNESVGQHRIYRDSCPGCPLCQSNAHEHRHRFGCLLLCVKCGIPHAEFQANPGKCVPRKDAPGDKAQAWAYRTGLPL